MSTKRCKISFLIGVLFIMYAFSGCVRTYPDLQEIKDIREDAQKIITIELNNDNGDILSNDFNLSGNGYIAFDVNITSGSIGSIDIVDNTLNQEIYNIKKPTTAKYDSGYNDYNSNSSYSIRLNNAKNIVGSIDVYYILD